MKLVVKLAPAIAHALRNRDALGEAETEAMKIAEKILRHCEQLSISLRPNFPNATSGESSTYFWADAPGHEIAKLQNKLLNAEGVEGAYVKPGDAPAKES